MILFSLIYQEEEKEQRWRQTSGGSDSSTGSSETSVWTTKMLPKISGCSLKYSVDNWPAGTLEEGAMMIAGIRASNNSESSDTTDTTATTTTTTILPTKQISMVLEN